MTGAGGVPTGPGAGGVPTGPGAPITPTALEVASGIVVGLVPPPPPPPGPARSPLAAMEQAILPALLRPPCVVSFSGGMDSSFVLAVATGLARREGLPLPLPVTWRFDDAPRACESPWQERVVAGLGLTRWEVLTARDELDVVGPVAQRVLARLGPVHPVNLHLHLPIVELARGGAMLTGAGGDQILCGFRSPRRPSWGTRGRRAVPDRIVDLVRRGTDGRALDWLHPTWSRRRSRDVRHELRSEPGRPDSRMAWHARRRDLLLTCANLDALGASEDVQVVNPLVAPAFVASLAREVGGTPGLTREDLLRRIGGDAVPDVATATRPKAHFLQVFHREPLRELVGGWRGEGVDHRFVDPARLAEAWSRWPVPAGTSALAQQVWLAHHRTPAPTPERPEVRA